LQNSYVDLSYGLGAEYQFASAPISLFGGWRHAEIDDLDSDADSINVAFATISTANPARAQSLGREPAARRRSQPLCWPALSINSH
jgi:hypothetical protein